MADFPQYRDLPVWSGDALRVPLAFTVLDGVGGRHPLDFTGAQVTFSVEWSDGGLRKSWPGDGGILVPDPAAGAIVLTATPEETLALPIGARARFSVARTIAEAPETLLYGRLIVSKWGNHGIG